MQTTTWNPTTKYKSSPYRLDSTYVQEPVVIIEPEKEENSPQVCGVQVFGEQDVQILDSSYK